jgi:aspartyl-tRNA(Asn)/glutamyl-tRNA(Gln) amidotransferase subunit C
VALSRADVDKIARLARLELTETEKQRYQEQLSAVLEYAARLNQLDLEGVAPTASAVSLRNVMREDEVRPSLALEDVLFNAARQTGDQFLIQPVLDEG